MLKMHFLLISSIILIIIFLFQNLLPKLVHLQYFVNHKLSGRQATIIIIDFVYVNNQILLVNLFEVNIMPLFTLPRRVTYSGHHVRLVLVGDIDVTFHITIVTDPEVSSTGAYHRTSCWTEVLEIQSPCSLRLPSCTCQ